MPKPNSGDLHVNRPLTNMSLAVFQDMAGFVADRICPTIPSEVRSDLYYRFDETYWNRDGLRKRAPGAAAHSLSYTVDKTPNFYCDVWAGAHPIPDQNRNNQDDPLDLDSQGMEFVIRMAKIRKEKIFVTNLFSTGLWTTEYTGISGSTSGTNRKHWSDVASDPITDVSTGKLAIMGRTGLKPNKLVVGAEVHEKLKNHPDIIDRVKYSSSPGSPAIVNRQSLAALFEVEQYEVMEAIEETSNVGGTAAPTFIGGKHAMLCYVAARPGVMTPSAAYNFAWTGHIGATREGYRLKKFRVEKEASDYIEIELAIDMKLTAANLGAFWNGIIA